MMFGKVKPDGSCSRAMSQAASVQMVLSARKQTITSEIRNACRALGMTRDQEASMVRNCKQLPSKTDKLAMVAELRKMKRADK